MSKLSVNGARQVGALLLLLTLPLAAQTPPDSPQPAEPAAPAVESPAPATPVAADDPSALPSEILPRASKSLLLDLVKSSDRYFVVGERGHILRSDDGKSWTQLKTPTRSTLTSVAAADGQLWAAGHDGVILHSADGGDTWQVQRRDPFFLAEGDDSADHDPRQGAPILDIHFSDAKNGIAVGAYSLMLVTHDGGATWTPKQAIAPSTAPSAPAAPMKGDIFSEKDLQLEDESDPHLNAVSSAGSGTMVIVGERGTFLRSSDNGETWQKLGFPYKGSMFGVLNLGDGRLLAYGLRGNVYESADLGSTWNKVETQASATIMGGTALEQGGAVLVGANGTLLSRAAAGKPFTTITYKNANGESPALSGAVAVANGDYLLTSDKGVDSYHLQ
jgi:photosystem II stability/assembly factor-like uncharacterized protein